MFVTLAACETPPPTVTYADLTYSHLGQMRLNVASIEVVSEYSSSMAKPNVEHMFPTPPEKALRQWAADRLEATGLEGVARFVITDAAVIETPLKKDDSLKGKFTKQQSERYEARVAARLEIETAQGKGLSEARNMHSITVREDASLNEREREWFRLTEKAMNGFDAEMEKQIRRYLVNWLM